MRRLLVLAAVTAAFAGSVPAANAYFFDGCQSDDWTAANVVVAGIEVAHVCTSDDPRPIVTACLRCLLEK